jgi:DNA polymerase I-like protein with 3'-5' exonuclease and polymerase domains
MQVPFGKILTPEEAIPLLLDRRISPVVSLDTEFDTTGNTPTCRAPLRGLSMAGGMPGSFFGTFWPFGPDGEHTPWEVLRDRVLYPIFHDADRVIVEHPPKVDQQILRARGEGFSDENIKAHIHCTMSLLHIYDENMPKGLKDAGPILLGLHDVATHAQVQQELRRFIKDGEKEAKATVQAVWDHYKVYRKKDPRLEAPLDLAAPSWQRLAMMMPAKLTRAALEERIEPRIYEVIRAYAKGKAKERYALYGALDALLTIGVYYFCMREILSLGMEKAEQKLALVRMEEAVCHPIVTEMEEAGFRLDVNRLQHINDAMRKALDELRADVIARWGVALELDADEEDDEADDEEAEILNPASRDQIADIVWNKWDLRHPPFTVRDGELRDKWVRKKDGLCRVNKDVLNYLAENAKEPFATHIKKFQSWASFEKLYGTFAMPNLVDALAAADHRVHPTTWPVGAKTGRFSQKNRNWENCPRPGTMPTLKIPDGADPKAPPPGLVLDKEKVKGQKEPIAVWRVDSLRKVVIPEDGWDLVSADLSQIENRFTAHESLDPMLLWLYRTWDCAECKGTGDTAEPLEACPQCGAPRNLDGRDKTKPEQPALKGFCLGRDIHANTAFHTGLIDKMGFKEGRQFAKSLNHAATYAMGDLTMAQRMGITRAEAGRLLEAWHTRHRRVRPLHKAVEWDFRDHGFVTMFDGHTRSLPAHLCLLRSGNLAPWELEKAVRELVNCKMQGGTAILMKIAMPRIRARLKALGGWYAKVRLVNQIHDELLYEAHKSISREVLKIVCHELEHCVRLAVPIIAEGGIGKDWQSAHA